MEPGGSDDAVEASTGERNRGGNRRAANGNQAAPAESMAGFDFRRVEPDGPLRRFVQTVWFARGVVPYAEERIAPTGSTVAAFVFGDPIRQRPANGTGQEFVATTGFLVGPHDQPMINAPTGETHAVGIVTTPIGCLPLFGVSPAKLVGRVVDPSEWWPGAGVLRSRLIEPPIPIGCWTRWSTSSVPTPTNESTGLDRFERAVEMVEHDPSRPVAEVAEAVGLSHGHLDDEFSRLVGLSPRTLSRLLRMRRLLEEVGGEPDPDLRWSELDARHGWFDHAHMIRDFKRHTGVSPTVYQARRRQVFGPIHPEPGFVPDPD